MRPRTATMMRECGLTEEGAAWAQLVLHMLDAVFAFDRQTAPFELATVICRIANWKAGELQTSGRRV